MLFKLSIQKQNPNIREHVNSQSKQDSFSGSKMWKVTLSGADSIKLYGSVNCGFVVTAKF